MAYNQGSSNDAQKNTLDSTSKDIKNGVRMGRNAAKAAKTVSKAAAKAATGNIAGAAKDVLKDPHTTKAILALLLIPILIFTSFCVVFLYALPTAIFEGVQSYLANAKEVWAEGTYAGGNNAFWAGIYTALETGGTMAVDTVSSLARSVWGGIKSLFGFNADRDEAVSTGGNDLTNGTEFHVTQEEAAERATLQRKLDAAIDKIEAREENIKSAIENSSDDIVEAVSRAHNSSSYDEFNVIINVTTQNMTDSAAVDLLSLYTVQDAASLTNVQLSGFMKWLGWYNSTRTSTSTFALGDIVPAVPIKTWNGTFLPQYLVEQREQEIELYGEEVTDFDQYRCAAVDFLIAVDCPNLSDLVVEVEERVIEVPAPSNDDDDSGEGNGEEGEPPETISVTIRIATVHVNINVRPRGATALSSAVGLWDGPLDAPAEEGGDNHD